MPRRRSNIGRRSRRANTERHRRSKRTDEKRLDDNERIRVRTSQKRAEELEEHREERLKALRVEAKKRRAARSSQIRLKERQKKMQLLINRDSIHQNDFSHEPNSQNVTTFKFVHIDEMDKVGFDSTIRKFKEEAPDMYCVNAEIEIDEYEQSEEPSDLDEENEQTENLVHSKA